MWVGCNRSVADPTRFAIKDCASRPPAKVSTADGNTCVALADIFHGRSQLMLLIENENEIGETLEDQQSVSG